MKTSIAVDVRMILSSGIGTYIRNILPRLFQLLPDEHFILLGNPNLIAKYIGLNNGRVEVIKTSSKIYSVAEQFELLTKIPRNISLFWSPHYDIPVLSNVPLVVTVHDLCHLALPKIGFTKKLYSRFMFETLIRKAKSIITVSDFTASELKRFVGSPSGKIKVIKNGVSEEWFNIQNTDRPIQDPYILYVGNVKPHKNLSLLIKAFKNICNKTDQKLLIVGQKENFITSDRESENLVEESSLRDKVIFTGYIPDSMLKSYYKHATMFVFPSLYEGFGLPPLEAMAAGCPVITSNSSSLPEVCGDAAEYFDPSSVTDLADKLYRLVLDHSQREQLSKRGLQRAKTFSWENSAKGTADVLKLML